MSDNDMSCTRCAVVVGSHDLCRWDGKKAVEYLCAGCCPYCSDDRHSVAATRHLAAFYIYDEDDEPPCEPEEPPRIVDLMEALERSLAAAKAGRSGASSPEGESAG